MAPKLVEPESDPVKVPDTVWCHNCGWIGPKDSCATYRGIGTHCPRCLPRGYAVMVDDYRGREKKEHS